MILHHQLSFDSGVNRSDGKTNAPSVVETASARHASISASNHPTKLHAGSSCPSSGCQSCAGKPLLNFCVGCGQPPPCQRKDFSRTHPRQNGKLRDQTLALSGRGKTHLHLLTRHRSTDRLLRFPRGKQQAGRVQADMAFRHCHLEYLTQVPAQVIHHRGRTIVNLRFQIGCATEE